MPNTFGVEERRILGLFNPGATFVFDGNSYTVEISGKPTCGQGEPKTDIYKT